MNPYYYWIFLCQFQTRRKWREQALQKTIERLIKLRIQAGNQYCSLKRVYLPFSYFIFQYTAHAPYLQLLNSFRTRYFQSFKQARLTIIKSVKNLNTSGLTSEYWLIVAGVNNWATQLMTGCSLLRGSMLQKKYLQVICRFFVNQGVFGQPGWQDFYVYKYIFQMLSKAPAIQTLESRYLLITIYNPHCYFWLIEQVLICFDVKKPLQQKSQFVPVETQVFIMSTCDLRYSSNLNLCCMMTSPFCTYQISLEVSESLFIINLISVNLEADVLYQLIAGIETLSSIVGHGSIKNILVFKQIKIISLQIV